MKFVNSKIHGILDYVLVFLLSISPFLFNYEEDSIHCRLLMVTALLLLLISLLTDFEFFLVKVFSFKTHLKIDFLMGIFLVSSPLIFDLKEHSIVPHLTLGIGILTVSFFTKAIGQNTAEPLQNDIELQEIKQ